MLVILAIATICAAIIQLSERIPLTPWEPAIAMEALRLNKGLPIYETAHATHLYGPLLTVTLAAAFQVFGINFVAARMVMSIFAMALVIFLSAILCRGKGRTCWWIAILLLLGINFRTNLILFSIQPDWAAAFFAIVALFIWTTGNRSVLRLLVSLALLMTATLLKQTTAAFALIPTAHVLIWKRPPSLRELALSILPTMSVLVEFAVMRFAWPQMFAGIVTIPAAIKVYPGRALSITFYLFVTFPIFLIALWSVWQSRHSITNRERWILSSLVVLVPISIWTTCKSGSGYNSLLFAYLAMTALFVARLESILDWLRGLRVQRAFIGAVGIALAILVSFCFQFEQDVALLSLRHGDVKYSAVVSIARGLDGVVVSPQDPIIPYRAKGYLGRSLFFELDTHAVNGNWPSEIPAPIADELILASHVVAVHSFVPTPMFERALPKFGFHQVSFPELQNSAYTVWSKNPE